MEMAWKDVPPTDFSKINQGMTKFQYEMTYGAIDKYEKEIDELKTKVMWWAVINRKKLWT